VLLRGHHTPAAQQRRPTLRCQRGVHAGDERVDAGGQRKIRGRFEGVGQFRLVHDQIKCLSPLRAGGGVEVRPDDAVPRRAVFDDFRRVYRADFRDARNHGFSL